MILFVLEKLRNWYLSAARPRLAEEVHTEYYFDDNVWQKIQNFSRKNQVTWYILTPANFDYIKGSLGTEMQKDELDKAMSERVKEMRRQDLKLQLHMHFWQIGDMPTDQKRVMLQEAREWGKKNGLEFTELTPGWNKIDDDLPGLCREFGLKLVNSAKFTHDFEL